MSISSNRAKKTYSFYRQRTVATEDFGDANRMAKTYGSARLPEFIEEVITVSTFILTENSEELITESGENLITES